MERPYAIHAAAVIDAPRPSEFPFALQFSQQGARVPMIECWDPAVDFASWLTDSQDAQGYAVRINGVDVASWYHKLLVRASVVVWMSAQLKALTRENWLPPNVGSDIAIQIDSAISRLRGAAQPWVNDAEKQGLREAYSAFNLTAAQRRDSAERLFAHMPASSSIVDQLRRPLVIFYSAATAATVVAQPPLAAHVMADPRQWGPGARERILAEAVAGAEATQELEWAPETWLGMREFLEATSGHDQG